MSVRLAKLPERPTPRGDRPLNNTRSHKARVRSLASRRFTRRSVTACLTVLAACSGGSEPPPPVASVVVTPGSSSLSPGGTVQLSAAPRDAQGNTLTDRVITWSSTNASIASVSGAGLVTAVAVGGPVTIVATSEGQDGSAIVTVIPPPVATVTLAPAAPTLTPGAVVTLVPTLRDAAGNTLTGRSVTWTSSSNGVATVSGAGVVTAVAVGGPVTITATSEGQNGTAAVTVVAPTVTTVSVSPAVTSVASGGTTPLSAVIRDQNNVIMSGIVPTWTTNNASIATVSPTGLVTGITVGGPATITATASGKTGTSAVMVTSSPCDGSTPIAIGQTLSGALASTDCTLDDGSFMDQFQIVITANARLQFDVASAAFDAYLLLFLRNPDGTKVAVGFDNNGAGGTNARLIRDVLAGETYVIGANSLNGGATGAYTVSVQTGTFMIVGAGDGAAMNTTDEAIARKKLARLVKTLR